MSQATATVAAYPMPPEGPSVVGAGRVQDYRLESVAFMHALVALAAKLVTIDGAANKAEYEMFHALFVENATVDTAQARSWFVQRGSDTSPALQYARQVAAMTPGETALHTDLMQRLVRVAMADAPLNAAELELLRMVAEVFGFAGEAFRGFITPQGSQGAVSPYALLGVSARASDKELRDRYMARVQSLHPDRYHGAGASAETLALLSDQLAALNAAYRSVQQARTKKTSRTTAAVKSWWGRRNTKGVSS